jgi:hypothetical protein
MKTIHLFLGLALVLGTLHTHAQPQWRFHLAFEDAAGTRDTLWFIYDTTATHGLGNVDTLLGEAPQTMVPGRLNVWTSNGVGDSTKTNAYPYTMFPYGQMSVKGFGYTTPLEIHWDTSLFQAPFLPSTLTSYIRHPRLCGYEIIYHGLETWPGTACISMALSDSLVFMSPPLESTFGLIMVFDYIDPIGTGISEHSIPSLDIFPNPAQGRIVVNAPEPLSEILLLDAVGRAVLRMTPPGMGPVELDVSTLPAGSYFVHARGRAGMYRGRVVVE